MHNLFNNIVFNNISIISTINQSILKGLEILVFEGSMAYSNSTNIDFLLRELKTLIFERSMAYSNSTNIDFLLRELETLVIESKHFLRMFIIKIHFKESSL